jgi:hypothetical protein
MGNANSFFANLKVKASSVTCSPFAATFSVPAIGGGDLKYYGTGYTCSEFPSNLFPACTITVTE